MGIDNVQWAEYIFVDVRKEVLNYNKKDKFMMEKLSMAIEVINALNVISPKANEWNSP